MTFEQAQMIIVLAIIGLSAFLAGWLMTWQGRQCGQHRFEGRQDHILDGNVWRPIYVRDVCTHCGATVERADAALREFYHPRKQPEATP